MKMKKTEYDDNRKMIKIYNMLSNENKYLINGLIMSLLYQQNNAVNIKTK